MNPGYITVMLALSCLVSAAEPLPELEVSENKRFLVTAGGRPFFYLGDTTWELFHRLNREQAVQLIENRASRKFNVLQAVAIAELEGHTDPNPYGHIPFTDLDVTKPAVKDGPQNDYWDHVDFIVREANARGLYIGFLPTWGRFWRDKSETRTPLFTVENAEVYGEWLGRRYKEAGLIWIVGGDRDIANDEHKAIVRAMAKGLRRGDGGAHLITTILRRVATFGRGNEDFIRASLSCDRTGFGESIAGHKLVNASVRTAGRRSSSSTRTLAT